MPSYGRQRPQRPSAGAAARLGGPLRDNDIPRTPPRDVVARRGHPRGPTIGAFSQEPYSLLGRGVGQQRTQSPSLAWAPTPGALPKASAPPGALPSASAPPGPLPGAMEALPGISASPGAPPRGGGAPSNEGNLKVPSRCGGAPRCPPTDDSALRDPLRDNDIPRTSPRDVVTRRGPPRGPTIGAFSQKPYSLLGRGVCKNNCSQGPSTDSAPWGSLTCPDRCSAPRESFKVSAPPGNLPRDGNPRGPAMGVNSPRNPPRGNGGPSRDGGFPMGPHRNGGALRDEGDPKVLSRCRDAPRCPPNDASAPK
ncbi:translation initiation factor IF-2-like [Homarus americanus]|uniref:translation initiation factor IF-2-like n=1 Tax=Homarus americanus TaxID=6706 RepID=UPI001C43EC8F|nr:translation initiation factor IF-2-like [Homarus americanus]